MTAAELAQALLKLASSLPTAKVVSYEHTANDFIPVVKIEVRDNGNEIALLTQVDIEEDSE